VGAALAVEVAVAVALAVTERIDGVPFDDATPWSGVWGELHPATSSAIVMRKGACLAGTSQA
jgi:hypothetical protein